MLNRASMDDLKRYAELVTGTNFATPFLTIAVTAVLRGRIIPKTATSAVLMVEWSALLKDLLDLGSNNYFLRPRVQTCPLSRHGLIKRPTL